VHLHFVIKRPRRQRESQTASQFTSLSSTRCATSNRKYPIIFPETHLTCSSEGVKYGCGHYVKVRDVNKIDCMHPNCTLSVTHPQTCRSSSCAIVRFPTLTSLFFLSLTSPVLWPRPFRNDYSDNRGVLLSLRILVQERSRTPATWLALSALSAIRFHCYRVPYILIIYPTTT